MQPITQLTMSHGRVLLRTHYDQTPYCVGSLCANGTVAVAMGGYYPLNTFTAFLPLNEIAGLS